MTTTHLLDLSAAWVVVCLFVAAVMFRVGQRRATPLPTPAPKIPAAVPRRARIMQGSIGGEPIWWLEALLESGEWAGVPLCYPYDAFDRNDDHETRLDRIEDMYNCYMRYGHPRCIYDSAGPARASEPPLPPPTPDRAIYLETDDED